MFYEAYVPVRDRLLSSNFSSFGRAMLTNTILANHPSGNCSSSIDDSGVT